MPIYEYQCRQCGHRFEYLVLPTAPAAECPACKKTDLEQLISLSSVSVEGTRQAHLNSERKKASAVHKDKMHEEHKQLHDHYD